MTVWIVYASEEPKHWGFKCPSSNCPKHGKRRDAQMMHALVPIAVEVVHSVYEFGETAHTCYRHLKTPDRLDTKYSFAS